MFITNSTFTYVRNNNYDTVVVFVHGVLSNSKKAFKIRNQEIYWWDIIKDDYPFNNFDFAYFDYDRVSLSKLVHKQNPINSAVKLAEEIYINIKNYSHVILIGHSQGGLISKAYAVMYCEQQSIYLTTMHTPHIEQLFGFVMRSGVKKEWDNEFMFKIPHLFATSMQDNKVVHSINALCGSSDSSYISYAKSKEVFLGHSHLNTEPDDGLINILTENIHYFINSGFNRNILGSQIVANNSDYTYKQHFISKSKYKILNFINSSNILNSAINGWEQAKKFKIKNNTYLYSNLINYNFFLHFLNEKVHIIDIDQQNHPDFISNKDLVYKFSFDVASNEKNFYEFIPFDPSSIDIYYHIDSADFYYILNYEIIKNGFYLKKFYTTDDNKEAHERMKSLYINALLEYKNFLIEDCFNCCSEIKPIVNYDLFHTILSDFIYRSPKKSDYINLFYIIKKKFYHHQVILGTNNIECIFSKLFKLIHGMYYIDYNIERLFFLSKALDFDQLTIDKVFEYNIINDEIYDYFYSNRKLNKWTKSIHYGDQQKAYDDHMAYQDYKADKADKVYRNKFNTLYKLISKIEGNLNYKDLEYKLKKLKNSFHNDVYYSYDEFLVIYSKKFRSFKNYKMFNKLILDFLFDEFYDLYILKEINIK